MFCLLSDIVTEPSPIIALHTLVTYYLVTNQLINLLAIPYLVDLTDATLAEEDRCTMIVVGLTWAILVSSSMRAKVWSRF